MKYTNQKMYNGRMITNTINKPLLHKKGKQWIVVGLSALMLAGFGGAVGLGQSTVHADTNTVQTSINKNLAQNNKQNSSASSNNTQSSTNANNSNKATSTSTSEVTDQAKNLHANLLANATLAPVTGTNESSNNGQKNNQANANKQEEVVSEPEVGNAHGTFKNLSYTSDGNGTVTFTGEPSNYVSDFLSGAPTSILNAKKLVFGTSSKPVDFSDTYHYGTSVKNGLENMFNDSVNKNIKEIDMNHIKGTNSIYNMSDMFGTSSSMPNLHTVVLGNGFNAMGAATTISTLFGSSNVQTLKIDGAKVPDSTIDGMNYTYSDGVLTFTGTATPPNDGYGDNFEGFINDPNGFQAPLTNAKTINFGTNTTPLDVHNVTEGMSNMLDGSDTSKGANKGNNKNIRYINFNNISNIGNVPNFNKTLANLPNLQSVTFGKGFNITGKKMSDLFTGDDKLSTIINLSGNEITLAPNVGLSNLRIGGSLATQPITSPLKRGQTYVNENATNPWDYINQLNHKGQYKKHDVAIPDFTHDTFREGNQNGPTVSYDSNHDTITISDGTLTNNIDDSGDTNGGIHSSLGIPTQIIDTTTGKYVPSDSLPNSKNDWTIKFHNVTAPNSIYFDLDGKNEKESTDSSISNHEQRSHNFIGNQVSTIDLSGLNTSKTTNMKGLMINDYNLKHVIFGNGSNFNTSNVSDMAMMLASDGSLSDIDLSSLNGNSLIEAWDMLNNDHNLSHVTLSAQFSPKGKPSNGEHVNLGEMLADDPSLHFSNIDWNGFNTQYVNDFYGMFISDHSLGDVDLPSTFDTSNGINFGHRVSKKTGRASASSDVDGMFQSDSNTAHIDLGPNFNTQKATNMAGMFRADKSLNKVNLGNKFKTSKVNDMRQMFGFSDPISDLNLPVGFDTMNAYNNNPNSSNNGQARMFESDKFNTITINSPYTIFNSNDNSSMKNGNKNKYSFNAWGYVSDSNGHLHSNPEPKLYRENGWKDANGKPTTLADSHEFSSGKDGNNNGPVTGTFTVKDTNRGVQRLHSIDHDIIYYVDENNNNIAGAHFVSGSDNTLIQSDKYNSSRDIPSGYTIDTNNSNYPYNFNFDNGNHNVYIKLNAATSGTTTINFITSEGTNVGNAIASDNGKTTFDHITMDDINNKRNGVSTNTLNNNHYHILDNTITIPFDGHSHDVFVAPNSVTDSIQYKANGSNIKDRSGNWTFNINGLYGTSGIVDGQNMPSDYNLANDGTNTFTFNGGTHYVDVTENQHADSIIFVNQNKAVVGSYNTKSGQAGSKLAGNSDSDTVANNMPRGYSDPNASNDSNITYDGLEHTINVQGNQINNSASISNNKPTTNSQYYATVITNAKKLNGTTQSKTYYVPIKGRVGDTYVLIPTQQGVYPNGYSVNPSDKYYTATVTANGLDNLPSRNTIRWNYSQPSAANRSTIVYYKDNDKIISFGSSDESSETPGTHITISKIAPIPSGYHLVDLSSVNGKTVQDGQQILDFAVAHNKATANIKYNYNGNSMGTGSAHGDTGSLIANISSYGLPNNYYVVPGHNYYIPNVSDGGNSNVYVSIAPNIVSETIQYYDKNKNQPEGNTFTIQGLYGTNGTISGQNMPSGYGLANDGSNTFIFNNGTHDVDVTAKSTNENDAINSLNSRIGKDESSLTTDYKYISSASSSINNIINESNSIASAISQASSNSNWISNLNWSSVSNQISKDENDISKNSSNIANNTTNIKNLNTYVINISNIASDASKAVSSDNTKLSNSVSSLSTSASNQAANAFSSLGNISTSVNGLKSDVNGLNTSMHNAETNITNDENRLNTDETNISNNSTVISNDTTSLASNISTASGIASYAKSFAISLSKLSPSGRASLNNDVVGTVILHLNFKGTNGQTMSKTAYRTIEGLKSANDQINIDPNDYNEPGYVPESTNPLTVNINQLTNGNWANNIVTGTFNYDAKPSDHKPANNGSDIIIVPNINPIPTPTPAPTPSPAPAPSPAPNSNGNNTPQSSNVIVPNNIHHSDHKSDQSLRVIRNVNDLNKLGINQAGKYRGYKVTRVNVPAHFRWIYIIKTCLAHNDLVNFGHYKNYRAVLRPNHRITLRINKVFKTQRGKKTYYNYEVRIGRHNSFVTGYPTYTRNAYYQPSDLRRTRSHGIFHHRYYRARLILNNGLYRSRYYTRRTFVRELRPGKIVHIKRIITIGRKGDFQTRFQLTNGDYITSNKNWIKLI